LLKLSISNLYCAQ